MPKRIIILVRRRAPVKPQSEHVVREEADSKDNDEGQHRLGDFPARADLARLALLLAGHVLRAQDEVAGHERVQDADHHQGHGVVHDEPQQRHGASPVGRVGVAHG